MNIPKAGSIAAHVLIDAVSVADDGNTDAEIVNTVYQRLLEAETFTVTAKDDGPDTDLDVTIDLSNVLGGALVTMNKLINDLAQARGVDRDTIIIGLREYIDE